MRSGIQLQDGIQLSHFEELSTPHLGQNRLRRRVDRVLNLLRDMVHFQSKDVADKSCQLSSKRRASRPTSSLSTRRQDQLVHSAERMRQSCPQDSSPIRRDPYRSVSFVLALRIGRHLNLLIP